MSDRRRVIGVVTVSRSDYGHLVPVLEAIREASDLELRLLVAGMHLSANFGRTMDTISADGWPIAEQIPMLEDSDTPEAVAASTGRGVARFAHAVGTILVKHDPQHLTQEFSKADRGGRILVDTGRNGYSATFAAAYAVRAKPGAPVSAPCTWEEIERGEVAPRTFTLRTMADRIAKVGDLWSDLRKRARSLRRASEVRSQKSEVRS